MVELKLEKDCIKFRNLPEDVYNTLTDKSIDIIEKDGVWIIEGESKYLYMTLYKMSFLFDLEIV